MPSEDDAFSPTSPAALEESLAIQAATEVVSLYSAPLDFPHSRVHPKAALGELNGAVRLSSQWPYSLQDRGHTLRRIAWVESQASVETVDD
eukprot:8021139-Pyramimonas_sp.AAC.1